MKTLAALVIGLLVAILALCILLVTFDSQAAHEDSGALQASALADLAKDVRSIRDGISLAGQSSLSSAQAGSYAVDQSLRDELGKLLAALKDSNVLLDRALASNALSLQARVGQDQPIMPNAMALDTLSRASAGVVPELFGMSPAEAYSKFGIPSNVIVREGTVRWYYDDPQSRRSRVVLVFVDGYLALIE